MPHLLLFPLLMFVGLLSSSYGHVITLEHAYDIALGSDQSVGIAALSLKKAELEPLTAFTRMGPTVTIGAREFWPQGSATSGGGGGASGRSSNSPASVTYEQPLFDLSVVPAYKRGKLLTQASKHEYRALMREVLFGVTSAYYAVLQQQSVVAVNRETTALAKETLDLAEKRVKAGEVTRTDALRATAQWQEGRRTLIEAEGALDILRNKLANILNLPMEAIIEVEEPDERAKSSMSLGPLIGMALQKRDDLLAQRLTIEQDVQRRQEIRATYLPKVSLQLSAFAQSSSGGGGGGGGGGAGGNTSQPSNWQAVLAVSLPFLNGGQREIQIKSAQYQIEQSRLAADLYRETVQQQVYEAWVNLRVLGETLEALRAQVEAATQGYKDLQNQYTAGSATSLDVLDALRVLNSARQAHTAQRFARQVAIHRLEQVTGTYQESRIRQIITP
jgi:outer membrane protein TolC